MSLQISALTSFTLQFLEQGFLQQLKKQAQTRSKPSKAVLQALKHSTALNKNYKTQLQTLKSQLSSANEENQFLKSMIDNLKSQIDFLKTSKQDKLKKFYEIQSNLLTKVQFLTNQNTLLKKQIQILKSKPQSQSLFSIKTHSEKEINFQQKINTFLSSALSNSIKNSQTAQNSVCLHQSSKFNQYLNFQSDKKQNYETQPNSKLKIELQESSNFNNTQKSSFGKNQCEQLTKMLNLRHDSNDYIDDEDPLAHDKGEFSSAQQLIQPKIIQITSENEICIEEEARKIQTPTLQRLTSNNVRESKFKVFAEDQKQSAAYNKGSQFTFLNLETRKSIQEGKFSQQSVVCSEKGQISLVKNVFLNQENCLKPIDDEICLDNISGVDYVGLMEDIQNRQDPIEQTESIRKEEENDDFFYKPSQNKSKEIGSTFDFEKVLRKRTISELCSPQKLNSVIVEVRTPAKQNSKEGKYVKSPTKSPNRQKQQQKVTIAVHQPVKYMTVAESYKTIDLSKSNKNIPTIENESKKSPSKKDLQIMKNSSSLMTRSRGSPKSMMNSKLMVINNARKNQINKTLTPFSMDKDGDENESEEPKSPTSLQPSSCSGSNSTSKSYNLIQSTRLKNMLVSNINNNKSMIERGDSPNSSGDHCLMGNYSFFRKKLEEQKMKTSIRPMVSFKNLDEDDDEKPCENYEKPNENDVETHENDQQPKHDNQVEQNF